MRYPLPSACTSSFHPSDLCQPSHVCSVPSMRICEHTFAYVHLLSIVPHITARICTAACAICPASLICASISAALYAAPVRLYFMQSGLCRACICSDMTCLSARKCRANLLLPDCMRWIMRAMCLPICFQMCCSMHRCGFKPISLHISVSPHAYTRTACGKWHKKIRSRHGYPCRKRNSSRFFLTHVRHVPMPPAERAARFSCANRLAYPKYPVVSGGSSITHTSPCLRSPGTPFTIAASRHIVAGFSERFMTAMNASSRLGTPS